MTFTVRIENDHNVNMTFTNFPIQTCLTFSHCSDWHPDQARHFSWENLPAGAYVELYERADCDFSGGNIYISPDHPLSVRAYSVPVAVSTQTWRSLMVKHERNQDYPSNGIIFKCGGQREDAEVSDTASSTGSALEENFFTNIADNLLKPVKILLSLRGN